MKKALIGAAVVVAVVAGGVLLLSKEKASGPKSSLKLNLQRRLSVKRLGFGHLRHLAKSFARMNGTLKRWNAMFRKL